VEAVKIVGTCASIPASSKNVREKKRNLKVAAQEVEVWRSIGRHPNIVELRRVFCDSHSFFMVMEMCDGTVAEKLDSNPEFLGCGLPGLLYQMLFAIKACHAASVVHRDIKPANYLIGMDEGTVKLCDFNLSVQLSPDHSLVGEFGTPPFMSPEMLKAQRYGTSTDIWSYGSMAYFMLFGELPYVPNEITSKAAKAAVRAGVPLPRYLHGAPHQRSADSVDLCCQLLQRDPGQRCSAQDALEHCFFRATLDTDKCLGVADTQSTVWSSTRRTSSRTDTQSTLHSFRMHKPEQHEEHEEQESDKDL
jgi:serine/threonine protein kinase